MRKFKTKEERIKGVVIGYRNSTESNVKDHFIVFAVY